MSKQLIKELTSINAISGQEEAVFTFLNDKLKDIAPHYKSDGLGSQIFKISGKNPGPNIVVAAHMDEVGLMLSEITDSGFAKVKSIGSLRPEVLLSSQVRLNNVAGKSFAGVVLARAPHGNADQSIKLEDLVIDFGFDSKEDYANNDIHLGDPISLINNYQEFGNDKLMAKAFDDRLGCAMLIELAERINNDLEYGNIYLCATVQEEIGLRGAQTVIQAIDDQIDHVLVVDVSPIEDAFGPCPNKLGAGALLRVADPRMIFDYKELHKIRAIAKEHNIAYQEYFSKGGTDAAMLQIQDSGYKVAALCIGGRNLHTNNSVINYNDYVACRDLSYHYIMNLIRG